MIEVPVFNQAGKKIETIQIDPEKLGGRVRKELLVCEKAGHCEIEAFDTNRYYDTIIRFIASAAASPSSGPNVNSI